MNSNIKFLQTGGVPLTNDLMATIQEAYQLFEVLGDVAGHLTILKGCEVNGSTTEPGIVAINGEVFPFEGGLTASTVFIHTQEIEKTFEDQTDKVLIEKKTVRFGNAVETYPWQEFVRLDTLKAMKEKFAWLQPIHKEIKWVGRTVINDELPAGWYIANGENGTDDLLGKMLLGYDPSIPEFAEVGASGGSNTHKLKSDELPSIKVKIRYANKDETSSWDQGDNTIVGSSSDGIESANWDSEYLHQQYANKPFSILPPYVIQVPIQYINN